MQNVIVKQTGRIFRTKVRVPRHVSLNCNAIYSSSSSSRKKDVEDTMLKKLHIPVLFIRNNTMK